MTEVVTIPQSERDLAKIVFAIRQLSDAINNLNLNLSGTTFANLPPVVPGTIAYITDGLAANCGDGTCTTWGTAVTGGGGALKLLVWYDGSFWTLIGD